MRVHLNAKCTRDIRARRTKYNAIHDGRVTARRLNPREVVLEGLKIPVIVPGRRKYAICPGEIAPARGVRVNNRRAHLAASSAGLYDDSATVAIIVKSSHGAVSAA